MSFWNDLQRWLQSLFQPPGEQAYHPQPPGDQPEALRPRVLLITFNPSIPSEGGRSLIEVLRWHNADRLCQEYIADLRECSKNFVDFQIVERIEVDAWPLKADGFCYDGDSFLHCWRTKHGFHDPDTVDYNAIIEEFDLPARVNADRIDEVWLFGFPYAGFYESIMVGPGAFWCNAPAIPRNDVNRRFVIMGFNYERGVGPMLESFGHRVESILRHVWRYHRDEDNLWKQFELYDKKAPGKANCGWMHYAPNSEKDYDWGNKTRVLSNCDDWLNFPDFRGLVRQVDCSEWGNGDMRAHHKWWFRHLPNAPGHTNGISNNWWWYGIDPNEVQ